MASQQSGINQIIRRNGRLIVLLVAALIAVLIVVFVQVHKNRSHSFAIKQACEILTPDIARKLGGNVLTQTTIKDSVTETNVTSFCVYRGQSSSITLAVRSAKNQQGVKLNHDAFSSPLSGSQTVRGYGDTAYWSPGFGQFNILEHDTWYILSDGINNPSARTLKQTEQLADAIAARL